MQITKSFLKHELQNIFMILGFYLQEVKSENKSEILKLIDLASFLVEYERFFLDEKVDFFLQPILLDDFIEILLAISESQINVHKIKIKKTDLQIQLNLNRDYLLKALHWILNKILEKASFVEIKFQKEDNTLCFLHDAPNFTNFEFQTFEKLLNDKIANFQEIFFQMGLKVLDNFGCQMKFNENMLKIILPEFVKK